MIRINLLAGERTAQKTKKASPSQPGAVQLYLFLALFVGGAIAACVFGWLYMDSKIAELDEQIRVTQQRKQELQKIADQVAEFEKQEQLLIRKVETIRQLKAQQGSAVRLLDEVSKSLPEFVWLDDFAQTGNALTFKGKSNSLNAVAEFLERLQNSPHPAASDGTPAVCDPAQRAGCWFPLVELSSSSETQNIITFALSADFKTPPPEKPPEEQSPAAAPAAGGQR
jgi:Tfp pilus assembly protein PilN